MLVGLDWAKPVMFLCCMSHVHAFSCIRTFNSLYYFILILLVLFCLSLSLPLSLSCVSLLYGTQMQIHCPKTLFVLGHPFLLLILFLLTYSSMMIKPERTFRRTFLDQAFIRNAKHSIGFFQY